MKKLSILLIVFSFYSSYFIQATYEKSEKSSCNSERSLESRIKLPENFYQLDDIQQIMPAEDKFFYIVVPECSARPSKDLYKQNVLKDFVKSIVIPKNFFEPGVPATSVKPVSIYFDWQEEESAKTRKQAGILLAVGLNKLKRRYKKSKFILVGMGQGGNVIHSASHAIKEPLDVVIELATPVFPKDGSFVDYEINKTMIKRVFSFYTEQDFKLDHPTLHPSYLHYNNVSTHPLFSTILLLINNKHPFPSEMMQGIVGKRLINLCKKIQDTYSHYNHLVAHISTLKPSVDLVVVLHDNSVFCNKKIDQKKAAQERLLSTVHINRFKKIWGRSLAINLKNSEQPYIKLKGINKIFTTQAS